MKLLNGKRRDTQHCLGAGLRQERCDAEAAVRLPKRFLCVFAAVLLLLSLQPASAIISIDNPEAQVGDLVHIKIMPALDHQELVIITPNSTYRFIGGIPENAAFIPETPGRHTIRVIDGNSLVDSASFSVLAAGSPAAEQPAERQFSVPAQARVGEPIIIDAPVSGVQAIGVKMGGEQFQYMESIRPLTFIPQSTGTALVWLRYDNGTTLTAPVEVVGIDPLLQLAAPERPLPSAVVREENGMKQLPPEQVEALAPGTYDIHLRDVSPTLKSVKFSKLKHDGSAMRVREVLPADIKGNAPRGVIDAFAIDPSGLEFESASFTFKAVGVALYKCKEYDYDANECYGANVKIMDLVPGTEYTLSLDNQDPLFSQTGYLSNPDFTGSTAGWTTLTESANVPTYSWIASDGAQSGVAQISFSTKNRAATGNYHQSFNITIPAGTTLAGINVSAKWRVPTYTSASPGWVNLSLQNDARTTTYCRSSATYSSVTAWATLENSTGTPGCLLSSFSPNTNYTVRLQCYLQLPNTNGANVACRWDDVNLTVWYNDTTAPLMRDATETPDPVNFNQTLNLTVNITDNIAVDDVFVEIAGTNHTMLDGPGDVYYYDQFSTSRTPGVYLYKLFFNDTNDNRVTNGSNLLNFTIRDINAPNIGIIGPGDPAFISAASFAAQYNVSDEVGVANCSLNVSGTLSNSTVNPPMLTTLNLSSNLSADTTYTWNITCNDSSGNRATSAARSITRDTVIPVVLLGLAEGAATNNASVVLAYTPYDQNLANCSLWTNTTGSWARNATNLTPAAGIANSFAISPPDGTYLWNVECYDLAGSGASNSTNRTFTVDRILPQHSGISLSPASGTAYAPGVSYSFNVTWTDERSGISVVMLETNATGTLSNLTPTQVGQAYTHTFTDLPAGAFTYRWYGTDAAGNMNQTPQANYTIIRASASLNLTLNGSAANISVAVNETINITGSATIPDGGYVELYRDGVRINSGQGTLSNTTTLTEEREYNFTLVHNQTRNYTAASISFFARVVDNTPPWAQLISPANGSVHKENITFSFVPHDNMEVTSCVIMLDGVVNETLEVAKDVEESIFLSSIAEGDHNWTVNCTDTSNNSAVTTPYLFTVDMTPPAVFSLLSPPSGTVASDLSPLFAWEQTGDPAFSRYTLQADNDPAFSSINLQQNLTPITNTSHRFALLDQVVWHWRVIAYDMAGNFRVSSQTSNYTADATPPSIVLMTGNNTHYNLEQITLNYTATDLAMIANCSLYVDGNLNQTDSTIGQGTNSFTIAVQELSYLWRVACTDIAGNAASTASRSFTIDKTPPAAFNTTGPADNTTSNDSTPTYTFTQSSDLNFANYTIQVSDNESFPYANYTLSTANITNTSITQSPPLPDGTWYWRVIAYDLAGNSVVVHPSYTVDTTPPTAFDLLAPPDGTEQRNTTPLMEWQQTQDQNFANYTIQVSDNESFPYVNATNSTTSKTSTSAAVTVPANTTLYWKVVAYDIAGNSRNSTSTHTYIADFANPVVSLVSPPNNGVVTASSLVPFRFNVTDPGTIANCSLYINGTLEKTVNSPAKSITQTINHNLANGFYTWNVSCTDIAGNVGGSGTRNVTVNVQTPVHRFYESSTGSGAFTPPASINLSLVNDSTESSVSINAPGGSLTTLVNARYGVGGQGMLIYNGTVINFSGVFDTNRAGDFYITWKAAKANASGTTPLCQSGDDNTGGTVISATPKSSYTGTCTSNVGDVWFSPGDNLTLTVNVYKSGGTTRTVTHYWEGASVSYMQLQADILGTLSASFTTSADPSMNETGTYTEQCNVTCGGGSCLSTDVHMRIWNGTVWVDVSTAGNITLNGTQPNPESLGNINSTNITNFTLYGNTHSTNTLQCFATSTYSNATSGNKTVTVVDRTPPTVFLDGPGGSAVFDRVSVIFDYTPYDRRLSSCTLWGNWSGTWAANGTNSTPANGSENSFGPLLFDYGVYKWNVQCNDTLGNAGFAAENRTLYIAGDVEITPAAINFSDDSPIEGQAVTITANVTNNANITYEGIVVRFWQGDPSAGGVEIGTGKTIDLAPFGSNTTSENWTAAVGLHDLYVKTDADDNIIEHDETNNNASRSIYLTIWQVYYGNVSGNLTLGTSANDSFAHWGFINQSGNIFIADSDTTNGISFTSLRPFGRNKTGLQDGSTLDDFEELDAALGTTAFNDSINDTYTENGVPAATESFTLFGFESPYIPVANSSVNFTTGLVWDSADSLDAHYDALEKEDVLFVTRLTNMTQSPNGLVDYEIRIPSKLREYKGTDSTVSFYYELQ